MEAHFRKFQSSNMNSNDRIGQIKPEDNQINTRRKYYITKQWHEFSVWKYPKP